ncbi:AraC family transcriptional regulator [Crocinitomicaceae bacterium]|nr:AraC family transcriptional regulator [Crocinitomicaceae bacterium]
MKVKEELEQMGLSPSKVELGVIELFNGISTEQLQLLKTNLAKSGLLIIDDKRSILIESIRITIINMIHYSDEITKNNNSVVISEKLGYDYTYLSNIFSETHGITIQQYIILQKIEKVKELLLYDELNISEIAVRMHYSSTAHLSKQFKKITGLSPSYYKRLKSLRNKGLENL